MCGFRAAMGLIGDGFAPNNMSVLAYTNETPRLSAVDGTRLRPKRGSTLPEERNVAKPAASRSMRPISEDDVNRASHRHHDLLTSYSVRGRG